MLLPERRAIPQVSIVSGDKRSLSIACASVIAKVWRDGFMLELDAQYPQYGLCPTQRLWHPPRTARHWSGMAPANIIADITNPFSGF